MEVKVFPTGQLQANCYVLDTGKKTLVIDPGSSQILKHLDKADLILLTHAHLDHSLGVQAVVEKYHCPVMLSKLEDTQACLLDFKGFATDKMVETFNSMKVDRYFDEGDEIEGLKVLSTPGHTAGSVCFLTDGMIFTGDTLFAHGYGRTDFHSSSIKDMMESLRRLKNLDRGTVVYPGHSEASTIDDIYYHY